VLLAWSKCQLAKLLQQRIQFLLPLFLLLLL
jgi:hypothetical protein